jgi:hypothetical protein
MDPGTLQTEVVKNNFYGHRFNSLNDLVITADGIAFFTDGYYGYANFNDTLVPELANGVYRWDLNTGNIKMVAGAAEGAFVNPNGVALNAAHTKLFVTNRGKRARIHMVDGLYTCMISRSMAFRIARSLRMSTRGSLMGSRRIARGGCMGLLLGLLMYLTRRGRFWGASRWIRMMSRSIWLGRAGGCISLGGIRFIGLSWRRRRFDGSFGCAKIVQWCMHMVEAG